MSINENRAMQFNNCVNNLVQCKLILVDKHIASLLSCVASIPTFTTTIADTLRNSSYVTEFNRARVTLTRPDGLVECKLKLPADKYRLFTFVVCLLMEVDSGRRDFITFLKEFFYNADSNVSYEYFVNNVMRPFKKAGESILKVVGVDSADVEGLNIAKQYFHAEKSYIPTEDIRNILSTIEEVRVTLNSSDQFIDDTHQRDCQIACNNLMHAIHLKNSKIIAMSFTALKYAVLPINSTAEYIQRLTIALLKLNLLT